MPGAGLLLIAAVASSQSASGAERWLSLEASRRCSAERDVLAARIDAALAGTRDPELVVRVELRDVARGTTARVRLARGSRPLGTKRIEASRCGEALDAVVAIAALALGTPTPEGALALGTATPEGALAPPDAPLPLGALSTPAARRRDVAALAAEERDNPEAAAHERPRRARRTPPPEEDERGPLSRDRSSLLEGWRWHGGAGVGRGALAATPIVATGVGVELGSSELRGSLEYGLPSSHELSDSNLGLERSEADFVAATFDSCHALDGERWLSLCAGVEARATRWSRLEERPDREGVARSGIDAAALAGGGVSIAYRAASWRPRLDVSAQLPIAGTAWEDGSLGVRAAFGASLPF
jgi:hypothetical protein